MKKNLERLIPKAMKAVKKCLANDKDEVPSAYNGYISSMGASIVQMGLLPTLAFYSYGKDDNKARSKENRPDLLKAILEVIKEEKEEETKLLDYALEVEKNPKKDLRELQQKVVQAAIAIKLAIRTFTLK